MPRPEPRPAVPFRGSRWPSALLTLLVMLAAVLFVGDRVAAKYAAQRVHDQITAELASQGIRTASTDVTIDGFPFLTQVAAGRYDQIRIAMVGVQAEGARLPRLDVVARGVTADPVELANGQAGITAEHVSGQGTVDWSSLADLVGQANLGLTQVVFAPLGDQVQASGTATVADQQVPVSATAAITLTGDRVKVRLSHAQLGGQQLSPQLQSALDDFVRNFAFTFQLPPLPFELTIDALQVEDGGLHITASATRVPLGR
jgi:hypothetical protein